MTVDAGAVAAGVVLDSNLAIDNPDATGFAGGSLVVGIAYATVNDVLSVSSIGGITVVAGNVFFSGVQIGTISGGTAGTPISIALSGTVGATEISALANAITLTNGSATSPAGARTVTYTVTDADGDVSADSIDVTIVSPTPGKRPNINNLDSAATFTNIAAHAGVLLDSNIYVGNPDTTGFSGGSLMVNIAASTVFDTLSVSNVGGITVVGTTVYYNGVAFGTMFGGTGGSPLSISLSGIVTSDEMSALANAITFTNSSPTPPTGARTITYTVTDFEGDVRTDTINVTLTGPVPSTTSPTILNLDAALTISGATASAGIVLDSDLAIDNPDATGFSGGSLVVDIASATPSDTLSISDVGGITVVAGNVFYIGVQIGAITGGTAGTPLSIALSDTVTPASISALANAVTLTNGSATPPTGPRTVTYTATDADGDVSADSINVTITPANVAPTAQDDGFATANATAVMGNVLLDNGNGADSDPDTGPSALTVNTTPVSGPANGSLTLNSDGSFTYTPNAGFSGTDSFTYEVSDGTDTDTAVVSIDVAPTVVPIVVNVFIAQSSDDVEETVATGALNVTSQDIDLNDTTLADLRFTGLGIPQGAIITSATIQFTADKDDTAATNVTIVGQDSDSTVTFSGTGAGSGRPTTSASVNWSPTSWVAGQSGSAQLTPDLTAVVQEIVDRAGWDGDSLAFFISGTGDRESISWDLNNGANAATLNIQYTLPPTVDNSEFTFAAVGDYGVPVPTGSGPNPQDVADVIALQDPYFVLSLGDSAYGSILYDDAVGKFYSQFIGNYIGAYPNDGSNINRFFNALGNHEYTDDSAGPNGGISTYLGYWVLPDNERYYDIQMGQVHVFVLDSQAANDGGDAESNAQKAWLQDALANSDAAYNIVTMHHPAYSSFGSPAPWMRWDFEGWGADVVLAGHDHAYERIIRDDNTDGTSIAYITSGLGGRTPSGGPGTLVSGSAFQYSSQLGSVLTTVNDSGMTFDFVTVDGVTRDSYFVAAPSGGNPLSINGNDIMNGSANSDYMNGLAGDDVLTGFGGADILIGDVGADRFVFADSSGVDVILDFDVASGDVIDLRGGGFNIADLAALALISNDAGNDLVIDLDGNDTLTLIGVNLIDLASDDFMF